MYMIDKVNRQRQSQRQRKETNVREKQSDEININKTYITPSTHSGDHIRPNVTLPPEMSHILRFEIFAA